LNCAGGQSFDQITCSKESLIPKPDFEGRMRKKDEACFNNMLVFMLGDVILFGGVWTGHTMLNPLTGNETREATILASPIKLKGTNVSIEKQLDMLLKQMKGFLNIGFSLEKINPGEPTKIIQKTEFKASYR
jgi:hypothetical protein